MKALAILTLMFTLLLSSNVRAGAPTCHSASGGYCQYSGIVKRIYINSGNIILIYFENAINISEAETAGFTISNGAAAAFRVSNNPDFAKMFYSTALAAQASGRKVAIQMRGVESGYLAFDRVWLEAP